MIFIFVRRSNGNRRGEIRNSRFSTEAPTRSCGPRGRAPSTPPISIRDRRRFALHGRARRDGPRTVSGAPYDRFRSDGTAETGTELNLATILRDRPNALPPYTARTASTRIAPRPERPAVAFDRVPKRRSPEKRVLETLPERRRPISHYDVSRSARRAVSRRGGRVLVTMRYGEKRVAGVRAV